MIHLQEVGGFESESDDGTVFGPHMDSIPCKSTGSQGLAKVTGCYRVGTHGRSGGIYQAERVLAAAVMEQPIATAGTFIEFTWFDKPPQGIITGSFLYKQKIYYGCGCVQGSDWSDYPLSHWVTVVGFGTNETSGTKYWIIRNSYGPDWGMQGYLWLERESAYLDRANPWGLCCVAQEPAYPVIEEPKTTLLP